MPGSSASEVTLEIAIARDAALLGNLMELYIHDLSAMFPQVKLGEDGRYGYPELPSYFAGGSARCAFIIRHEGSIAGFALARQGSPASDDPNVLDVAEFFVLRPFRARGVGRAAAVLLWDRMPGSWTIRASASNPNAIGFWRHAVAAYAGQRATESERSIGGSQWVVLCFDSSSKAVLPTSEPATS